MEVTDSQLIVLLDGKLGLSESLDFAETYFKNDIVKGRIRAIIEGTQDEGVRRAREFVFTSIECMERALREAILGIVDKPVPGRHSQPNPKTTDKQSDRDS